VHLQGAHLPLKNLLDLEYDFSVYSLRGIFKIFKTFQSCSVQVAGLFPKHASVSVGLRRSHYTSHAPELLAVHRYS